MEESEYGVRLLRKITRQRQRKPVKDTEESAHRVEELREFLVDILRIQLPHVPQKNRDGHGRRKGRQACLPRRTLLQK